MREKRYAVLLTAKQLGTVRIFAKRNYEHA
jgi:hypothetical protein